MASGASTVLILAVVSLILIFLYNNVNNDGDDDEQQRRQQQQSCSTKCGIHNISYPFRLEDSPKKCGDERYILSCEDNDQLILYYESKLPNKKRSIFGSRETNKNVRIKGLYKFSSFSALPYLFYQYKNSFKNVLTRSMLYYEDSFFVDSYNKSMSELGLGDGCHIEFMYLTSWPLEVDHGGGGGNNNMSCTDIRNMMFYGFELSWINSLCKYGWFAKLHDNNQSKCEPSEGREYC
ncbi:hypothetical protein P8452_01028 [Trifolium repens]|nr:hypothetical protein P8452_01028 [Trifolium repens]